MPFPSCRKPLFQSEAKCDAVDMKNDFFYSPATEAKLIFTRKVLYLASFCRMIVFGTRKWTINFFTRILMQRMGKTKEHSKMKEIAQGEVKLKTVYSSRLNMSNIEKLSQPVH